jgi:hypothetical protein
MPDQRAERLSRHARERAEHTGQRARQALAVMAQDGEPVTVAALAAKAGVSRSWIYTQPELRDQVEQLQRGSPADAIPAVAVQTAEPASTRRRSGPLHQQAPTRSDADSSWPTPASSSYEPRTSSSGGPSPKPWDTAEPGSRGHKRQSERDLRWTCVHDVKPLIPADVQAHEVEIMAGLVDRLLHRGVVVAINGPSYRMRAHQQRTEQLRKAVAAGSR